MSKNINIPFIDFNNMICLSELKRWLNEYKIGLGLEQDRDNKNNVYAEKLKTEIEFKKHIPSDLFSLLNVLNDRKCVVKVEMSSLYELKVNKKRMNRIESTVSKKFLIDGKFIKRCKSKKRNGFIIYKMTLAAFVYYILFETYFINSKIIHVHYLKRPELELCRTIDFLNNCKSLVTVKIPPRETDVHRKQKYYIYIDR